LVLLAQPVPLGQWAVQDLEVLLELVEQWDPVDLWEPPVSRGLLEGQDFLESRDYQEHRVIQERPVKLVLQGHKELPGKLACQGLVVQKVLLVQQEPRVTLELQVR